MRKRKLLEELDAARHATDWWSSLVKGQMERAEKLEKQNAELRIENAVLKERLKNNSPDGQENHTND